MLTLQHDELPGTLQGTKHNYSTAKMMGLYGVFLTILFVGAAFIIGSVHCFQIPVQPFCSRQALSVASRADNIYQRFNFLHRQDLSGTHYNLGGQSRSNYSRCRQCHGASRTNLFSLKKLVEDVSQESRSDGQASTAPHTIFVGGKGGVGKTTISSALAVHLASTGDLKVLIVSTDPAHSLGDALDEDLKRGKGQPVTMSDPLTGGRLSACEVDASGALDSFRESLAAFDINRLSDVLGVPTELLENLGLREFSSLLNNPPPGFDELIALANVLDNEAVVGDYDVVVVDTAPTGHTLRLLALPQFIDGLFGKLIKLRQKLSSLATTLQAFLGSASAQARADAIDNTVKRLEKLRDKMSLLQARLKDSTRTRFVVVTVPTKLGVAESKRLVADLNTQSVRVSDIVINQCVGSVGDDGAISTSALEGYYQRRRAGQDRWIDQIQSLVAEVSASDQYKSNGSPEPIQLTQVPFFDVELVGVPALYYVGSQSFVSNPNFARLMEDVGVEQQEPRVVICGGKGGVGKTTTACSLAVAMAAQGHKVALISTDPAHSVGDAIDMNLSGGQLIDCPLIGVPNPEEGSLSVMEIDPALALKQFKGWVDNLAGGSATNNNNVPSGVANTLRELQEVFDTLPAGTDEVVALGKIVNLIKDGDFDRIVLDTAPTGHTLRMLSTPGFLADLIERILVISDKLNSNAAVRLFLASATGGGNSGNLGSTAEEAKSKLLSFQFQMYSLEDLFANAEQTEFVIVTVPTELAVRESMRLLNDLTFEAPEMPIKVRNVVLNQVLKQDGSDIETFLSHVAQTQQSSVRELEKSIEDVARTTATPPPTLTKINYLDTEPRGVFGLNVLANELLREEDVTIASATSG